MMPQKTALIAGASGLVGSYLLRMLLQSSHYDQVISVGRRKLDLEHPKLKQLVVDFDKLAVSENLIADDIFCCLGTTMKKAGSKEKFYAVDHTYVVELAKATSKNFARQFLVVSAMGADANSRFYYNRVKGEMEAAVQKFPFTAVHIFRPSLLTGNREETRLGEKIGEVVMNVLNPVMLGPLKKYRSVEARSVAKTMLKTALESGGGVKIHESDEIAAVEEQLPD